MTAAVVIRLARKHIGGEMESSARVALYDAVRLWDAGDYDAAKKRAIDSLRYSVGVNHPDYRRATR